MAEYVEQTFSRTTEVLDGNDFKNCVFENCTLIYQGGMLPSLINCKLQDCRWEFRDGADRTIAFLRALYHGLGDNGKQVIDQAVEAIKRPL